MDTIYDDGTLRAELDRLRAEQKPLYGFRVYAKAVNEPTPEFNTISAWVHVWAHTPKEARDMAYHQLWLDFYGQPFVITRTRKLSACPRGWDSI